MAAFQVQQVPPGRLDEAVEVLCEAFFDYPVMRFVIGDIAQGEYFNRLTRLVSFFTEARFLKNDIVLAVYDGSQMIAVANINRPASAPPYGPTGAEDPLEGARRRCWGELGVEARRRYEAYGAAAGRFVYPEPHFHLGLIGARRTSTGKGHARRLLETLHELSAADFESKGVSLTTEVAHNLPIYERFGYRTVGHERFAGIETWGFFRNDP